jgi:hypothetical protein
MVLAACCLTAAASQPTQIPTLFDRLSPRPRYCHRDDVSHTSCAEWLHTYARPSNQEASSQQRHQHTLHTLAAPTVDLAAFVCIAEPGHCNTALPSPNLQPIDPPPFQYMCSTCSRIKSVRLWWRVRSLDLSTAGPSHRDRQMRDKVNEYQTSILFSTATDNHPTIDTAVRMTGHRRGPEERFREIVP